MCSCQKCIQTSLHSNIQHFHAIVDHQSNNNPILLRHLYEAILFLQQSWEIEMSKAICVPRHARFLFIFKTLPSKLNAGQDKIESYKIIFRDMRLTFSLNLVIIMQLWNYFGPSDDGIVIESGIRENVRFFVHQLFSSIQLII